MSWALWIDDEQRSYIAVRLALEEKRLKVRSAYTIADAVELLQDRQDDPPDAIILDILLPAGRRDGESIQRQADDVDTSLIVDPLARYTGIALYNRLDGLQDRVVVLSMVTRTELRSSGLPKSVPTFSKTELTDDIDGFLEKIDQLSSNGQAGPEAGQ